MRPKLLTLLPSITPETLLRDGAAGVTVALVALPLSIAIAIASGAEPQAGLVTAIIGGFLISALGGSRVQIGGPTGAFIVVVAGVIAAHGYGGLVTATFLAGIILIAAALLRLGRLIALVPEPVVDGFTVGIAVIIAASQFTDALGLRLAHAPADFLERLPAMWAARASFNPAALGLALTTGVMIIVFRRAAPRWPGLILAIALASIAAVIAHGFGWTIDTVGSRFGDLPQGFPAPRLPELNAARIQELLPSAFVIAFLTGIESLLSAVVADRMIGGKHRPGAELLAQGAANIGSALFGGLPATGAIARTATNIRAGGATPIAGMTHAAVLLLIALVAAPLITYLAMPALAALLLLTAWNMSEPGRWRERWRQAPVDRALFALTLALTVLTDLTIAIAVGAGLGLALRLAAKHRSDAA